MDTQLIQKFEDLTKIVRDKYAEWPYEDRYGFEDAVNAVEAEYHGVNYETGHEDGFQVGYDACLEEGFRGEDVLDQAIEVIEEVQRVCQECERYNHGVRPGILCQTEGCRFAEVAKGAFGIEVEEFKK